MPVHSSSSSSRPSSYVPHSTPSRSPAAYRPTPPTIHVHDASPRVRPSAPGNASRPVGRPVPPSVNPNPPGNHGRPVPPYVNPNPPGNHGRPVPPYVNPNPPGHHVRPLPPIVVVPPVYDRYNDGPAVIVPVYPGDGPGPIGRPSGALAAILAGLAVAGAAILLFIKMLR